MEQAEKSSTSKHAKKPFGFFDAISQAFSLIFALQNHAGRKKLLDLAESNPKPLILSGVFAAIIFFLFCFISSQIVIRVLLN
ncbi:hypothetical protein [Zhongshania sp.]|uniref:hypothetical protein n=1 Tax=Zhongshania sp. TaxID=1971902 RepID=UPI001B4D76CA|nr:hypothetical protein [Zhongshania sp.]MBQ0797025.1 hypothetical protein [Zhongshania sp.]